MITTVVNLYRHPYDVYIGRGSPFGNPYPITKTCTRQEAVQRYQDYFYKRIAIDPEFREAVLALRGKRLGCYCAPKLCHGDVIVDWLGVEQVSL